MAESEQKLRRAKKHVLVLRGGTSIEHEVSMNSGALVAENIDRDRYHVHPVTITRTGEWEFEEDPGVFLDITEALPKLREMHIDCVFITLHGPRGEDGRIQGLLDMLSIPYIGSGCAASALAMDKIRSKMIARQAGIPVPEDVVFTERAWEADPDSLTARISLELGYPCVVKSPWQGSSLGMSIPQSADELNAAIDDALSYGKQVIVEKFVAGAEYTCSVLDTHEQAGPMALPVTEIRPATKGFFDYQSKYTPGASVEITPAEMDDDLRREIQDMSVRAHIMIGCRGLSRSDMILGESGLVWLEINTIPGLTQTSLFPQAAEAAGISFTELTTQLIEAAV